MWNSFINNCIQRQAYFFISMSYNILRYSGDTNKKLSTGWHMFCDINSVDNCILYVENAFGMHEIRR